MAVRSLSFLLWLSLARHTVTIQVTPNSPCSSRCVDSSDTVSADIVCEDADFASTNAGSKWKTCMNCLQNSTHSQGGESDQAWFLYNLRYSFDSCVFAYPNGTGAGSNPCETSTACGPLKTALEHGNLSSANAGGDELGYCDADGGIVTGQYYQACLNCVSNSGDTNYLANTLVALEAGCLQKPNATDLLGLSGSVFSNTLISVVDPSTLNKANTTPALSTAAIAGIAAGGGAILILVAVIVFFRCRKRRNRSVNILKPRWARDKRRSSFSFKCRNIIASPLSPKFFSDLPPVEEQQQQYGSLNAQVSDMSMNAPAAQERYFIETKPSVQRHPYETSLNGWRSQDVSATQTSNPPNQIFPVADQWNTFDRREKRGASKKTFMTIDTSEAKLAPPPAAHPSPKQNQFDISPSATQSSIRYYAPAEHGSPSSQTSSRAAKPKTTTMSSQGSGYPSTRSPNSSSPSLRHQQQHGWPSARETQEPWFPPPPPSGPPPSGPPPSSTKYGRKVSSRAARKARRESGSPVESKQIQVSFPPPPQR